MSLSTCFFANRIAVANIIPDNADGRFGTRDGGCSFGGIIVKARHCCNDLIFKAGSFSKFGCNILPALIGIIDDHRWNALRFQLRIMLKNTVGARRRCHDEIRLQRNDCFNIEIEVGIEHLNTTLIRDLGPLRKEALFVGQHAWSGRCARDNRRVDCKQNSREAWSGRNNPHRL
ncbi:hypothetical protein D9M69_516190 [compost metagenome]